ncbi:MAG: hypothetical protein H6767_00915 [Candidatus Peribacteria bacterium]|nr:MAG: hypothetical protein H6767_00915 [Candidatus Peribacteria bacterium]
MVFYANTFNPGIIKNINGTLESMELRRDMDISEILRTLVDNEYTAIADE